jgi:hypothetical protein
MYNVSIRGLLQLFHGKSRGKFKTTYKTLKTAFPNPFLTSKNIYCFNIRTLGGG